MCSIGHVVPVDAASPKRVVPDHRLRVIWIDIDEFVSSFWWNEIGKLASEVSMRIKEGTAISAPDILFEQIPHGGGLSRPGLPDHIEMAEPIFPTKNKRSVDSAPQQLAKINALVIHRPGESVQSLTGKALGFWLIAEREARHLPRTPKRRFPRVSVLEVAGD
jgi:hypothetical protein